MPGWGEEDIFFNKENNSMETKKQDNDPTYYAVCSQNWQYNDEGYDLEDDHGNVIKAFKSEVKAKAHAYDLNLKDLGSRGDSYSHPETYAVVPMKLSELRPEIDESEA